MAIDAAAPYIEVAKGVVVPAIAFVAGVAAQWLLQDRKSRDEIIRALAVQRAAALCRLWEITTLPVEITTTPADVPVPGPASEALDRAIVDWYTKEAGALYLSWDANRLVFELLDGLRSEPVGHDDLERSVARLRSRLKRDCGIYSASEAGRPLVRPRASRWMSRGVGAPPDRPPARD